ncbi:MAG: DOMON-like domain-containing protein [Hyphomonadaceae bacterium]
MSHALEAHPESRAPAISQITAAAARTEGGLAVTYRLTGATGALRIPALAPAARGDELWRHTCFEVFVMTANDGGYDEFNFAPSAQWAAYRFSAYRAGMRPLEIAPPAIETRIEPDLMEMRVRFGAPDWPAWAPWRLALSAVIEDADGVKSYWALAHPFGRPDFHHAHSFALILPAPEPA